MYIVLSLILEPEIEIDFLQGSTKIVEYLETMPKIDFNSKLEYYIIYSSNSTL